MAYRTLDPGYTLPYIPIRVLYHTKLQTLFTITPPIYEKCRKKRKVKSDGKPSLFRRFLDDIFRICAMLVVTIAT